MRRERGEGGTMIAPFIADHMMPGTGTDTVSLSPVATRLRSYIDLYDAPVGPMMGHGPVLCFAERDSLLAGDRRPDSQRILSGGFRHNLAFESRVRGCAVAYPSQMPKQARSDRWQFLCERTEQYPRLPVRERLWLARMWVYLGFHQLAVRMIEVDPAEMSLSWELTTLGYLRGLASFMLALGDLPSFAPTDYWTVVTKGDRRSRGFYEASKGLLIYHARATRDVAAVRAARENMEEHLKLVHGEAEETFSYLLLMSAHYRGVSYLPMLEGDFLRMTAEMDLAEQYAYRAVAKANDARERLLAQDNLHPLNESRMREALVLGDRDLALERIGKVLAVDPWDSKAHIERGELLWARRDYRLARDEFLAAARYGPPGTAIGYYMAGECCERLDQPEDAMACYLWALQADPGGNSTLEALERVAGRVGQPALARWCADERGA